ncbi:hypothetical protein L226DRAFT_582184 [Lentinus tigrinus ALCF2SS1-7]|uniref:uncharacterized protein n=1 Tax=Lentinus tigrinus ALCF2SS1-7 TaxID=1328758 RepID=UPI0011663DE8|nr:hypothetical protein L226DRAFT_582184 [Lentinus tigrinus ALCF2SS1-7]
MFAYGGFSDTLLIFNCPRTSWSGITSLKNVVVFGDSYSTPATTEPEPNDEDEEDAAGNATWVDHLQCRLGDRITAFHNFSFPGSTTEDDLETQLTKFFAKFPPKRSPQSDPPLDPSRTSFVLHLGINDCGATDEDDLDEIVEKLLDAAHDLYVKAGARNFIFMDVIPIDRTPGAQATDSEDTMRSRVEVWNESLRTRVAEFAESSSRASVFLYSTHKTLTEVLDDPEEFGYTVEDVTDEGGGIWLDDIHATSSVHKILAERFAKTFFPDL